MGGNMFLKSTMGNKEVTKRGIRKRSRKQAKTKAGDVKNQKTRKRIGKIEIKP